MKPVTNEEEAIVKFSKLKKLFIPIVNHQKYAANMLTEVETLREAVAIMERIYYDPDMLAIFFNKVGDRKNPQSTVDFIDFIKKIAL